MHLLFTSAGIIILLSLPFWLFITFLLLNNRINISFHISGIYSLSNIKIIYISELFSLFITIENVKLTFSFLRFRLLFTNSDFTLQFTNAPLNFSTNDINSINSQKIDYNYLKQKFSNIIQSNFSSKTKSGNNLLSKGEIDSINCIINNTKKLSLKDYILLFFLNIIDLYFDRAICNMKIKHSSFFHSVKLRKGIFGFIKAANKTAEIDFISVYYDLEVYEYTNVNSKLQHSKLNKIFNLQSDYSKEKEELFFYNKLVYLPETVVKIKMNEGFFPLNASFANTISITIESNDFSSNISTKSINNIIEIIVNFIEIKRNAFNSNYNTPLIQTTEEMIIRKIDANIRKFLIKIERLQIDIYSDNFLFKHMVVTSKQFTLYNINDLYIEKDTNGKMCLLSNDINVKFTQLKISTFKRQLLLLITEVPFYQIKVKNTLFYNTKSNKAEYNTIVSSQLSDVDVTLTSLHLDKVIDIVIAIVDGDNLIEHHLKKNCLYITHPNEVSNFVDSTAIDFSFNHINIVLYSNDFMFFSPDVSLKLTMDKVKNEKKEIYLRFSPLNISFALNENNTIINNYYVGNALIDKMVISIKDNEINRNIRNIKISFDNTLAISHDFHLMHIIKFLSQIVGSIIELELQRKFIKSDDININKHQNSIILHWNDVSVVNYLNREDVIYGTLKEFDIDVDDHLSVPHFTAYHSNAIWYNFFHFVDLDNFYIQFNDKENEINLLFEDIKINAYTPEISRPVQQFSHFYTFFPDWLDYYLTLQFIEDENTLIEKYKYQKSKKKKCKLTFVKIDVAINDTEISKGSFLQVESEKLKEAAAKSDSEVIKYLKNIKKDLLTVQVSGFTIETDMSKSVKENTNPNHNGGYYVDTITANRKVKLFFGEIKTSLEQHEILYLKDFRIECYFKEQYNSFNPLKNITNIYLYDKYWFILHKAKSKSKRERICEIFINNLRFSIEDVNVFDKTLNYTFKCVKVIANLPFDAFDEKLLTDSKYDEIDSKFNLTVSNLDGGIYSLDPQTRETYNKLDIKIAIFALSTKEKEYNSKVVNNVLELSMYYFIFGFDPSQKSGFPLLIMPLAEANFDNMRNIIRVNIPTEISNKSSYTRLFNEIYTQELNKLVMETKSLTLFINFKYLSTFFKIFEIFWEKTKLLRQSLAKKLKKSSQKEKNIKKKKNTLYIINNNIKSNIDNININELQKFNINNNSQKKFMLSLFDLKLIYLLEYKKEHEPFFVFHPFVKAHRFFGYIFRLYSFSLKYEITSNRDSFYGSMNLLTISLLDDDNFSDDDFFLNDREIETTQFLNLKQIDNFTSFMELENITSMKLINRNLNEYFASFHKENDDNKPRESNFCDLKFDYRHIFAKISNVILNSSINVITDRKEFSIIIDNIKLTWNKFNKDVITVLLFEDVLHIVDGIILKLDIKKEKKGVYNNNYSNYSNNNNNDGGNNSMKKDRFNSIEGSVFSTIYNDKKTNMHTINNITALNYTGLFIDSNSLRNTNSVIGEFNFVFEIKNPQIVMQNEIKKSTLLLMTKMPIKVVISKFSFADDLKDFKLEFICDSLFLFSAPKSINSEYIQWIGRSSDNKYYLSESLFGQIIETPKIRFITSQQVESYANGKFRMNSRMEINVDKIKGDFESSYFTDFLNIVEVFLFDRGYSFAEEKARIDAKRKDMQSLKKSEIKFLIQNSIQNQMKRPSNKNISFYLGEVIFNLCKGGKSLMQFLLINFEGNHEIFIDKSSEMHINVRNVHIKNLENNNNNNKNDIIFYPLYSERLGNFEDKINIVTFTKKDRYVAINTDSIWYGIDYLEFNVRPVVMNITKAQIEFILGFFFEDQSSAEDEEQIKGIKQDGKNKENKEDGKPIYFKHFKVNETEVLLNFEYGEAHPLNIPRTKLKFGTFDKQEKFYPMKSMMKRFTSHCKKQCIKNFGAIISGLFSSSDNDNNVIKIKKKGNDEESHRKLLFGNK